MTECLKSCQSERGSQLLSFPEEGVYIYIAYKLYELLAIETM